MRDMRDSYTDHLDLRESLYAGDLFLCPPLPSSQRLVSEVKTLLKKELSEDYRAHAHVEQNIHVSLSS